MLLIHQPISVRLRRLYPLVGGRRRSLDRFRLAGNVVLNALPNISGNLVASYTDFVIAATKGNFLSFHQGAINATMQVVSVSDNKGNFWQLLSRTTDSTGFDANDIWYAKNAVAGVTIVRVLTIGTITGFGNQYVVDASNVDPVNPFPLTQTDLSNQPSTANIVGPSITLPQLPVVPLIVTNIINSNGTSGISAGGFTYINQSIGWRLGTAAPGTYSPTWTNSAGTWCGTTFALQGFVSDVVMAENRLQIQ